MDIIVRVPWNVIVEDVADALDVETAGGDIGSDQDIDLVSLEPLELADPLRLLHVAMDLTDIETAPFEARAEFAHRRLTVAEDDRGPDLARSQQGRQGIPFAAGVGAQDALIDQQVGRGRPGHLDRLGIGQESI